MITKSIETTEVMETIHGVDARNLYNSPELIVTVITLQPGERLKRHGPGLKLARRSLFSRPRGAAFSARRSSVWRGRGF